MVKLLFGMRLEDLYLKNQKTIFWEKFASDNKA